MKRGKVKKGYMDADRVFDILGQPIEVNGQSWTPVLLDGDEDPTYIKTACIEEIRPVPNIEIIATATPLDYDKITFPCLCVSIIDSGYGHKYRWEHARIVNSVVRGPAYYFQLKNIRENKNG